MQRFRTLGVVLMLAAVFAYRVAGHAQAPKAKAGAPPAPPAKAAPAAPAHVLLPAADVKWGPGPAALPPGGQMAVVDGDPSKAGAKFVIRAKMPDGYRVPPHFHPTDENIIVISGNLAIGMGDKWDDASLKSLGVAGFARMPKGMHHFALARGATEIQVHGVGPFDVTYLNPKDDPRKK
jgi:hypothetical protein